MKQLEKLTKKEEKMLCKRQREFLEDKNSKIEDQSVFFRAYCIYCDGFGNVKKDFKDYICQKYNPSEIL